MTITSDRNDLQRRIAELEKELRKCGDWHHPSCRKMIYDISSSPCTCDYVFEELEQENEKLSTALAELHDRLKNGISYDEKHNQYVLVWTKRELEVAQKEAEKLYEFFKGKDK